MAGKLTFDELKEAVASGQIDTVVVALVDMQGRLMGKRFQAEFFVESAWQETHSCNYLLATDMEMVPVEGYQATSWETGYGGYVMKPDLTTLRRTPWLEGTALVLCDVLDHHGHEDVPHAPRAILKKQLARLEAMAMKALDGSAMLRAAMGDQVVDHYLHAARWEQFEDDSRVSDWEVGRGFERA